jgi:hypothetical protein
VKGGRRGGSKPHGITPQKRRAAKALGLGKSNGEAAAAAGLKGKRNTNGRSILISEWKKDPEFRALIDRYAEEAMSGPEWEARNAAQARMAIPVRVVTDAEGRVLQAVYESDRAMDRQGRALGKLRDIVGGPGGGPIQHEHRFAEMTDEELRAFAAKKAAEAGLQVRSA